MEYASKIEVIFAIMEIEAWILAMPDLLHKINNILTNEYIIDKLGINLHEIDPQKEIYKPSDVLRNILSLCGFEYKKRMRDVEAITSGISYEDISMVINSGKCERFSYFYDNIFNLCKDYIYSEY